MELGGENCGLWDGDCAEKLINDAFERNYINQELILKICENTLFKDIKKMKNWISYTKNFTMDSYNTLLAKILNMT